MSEAVKRGFKRLDFGFWQFDGVLLSGLHPTKITVTDTAITFDYTVGGQAVSRAYALTKSNGKITSFTNPDGTNVEVGYGG